MKVLHLITGLNVGGTEVFLTRIIPQLKQFEHVVVSLTSKLPLGLELEKHGIKVYELKSGKYFSPLSILNFYKIVSEEKPKILITYLIHAAIFGRFFGKLYRIPKIICMIRSQLREKKHVIYFLFEKLTDSLVNVYISNSCALANFYIEKLGISKNKIETIYSPINFNKINSVTPAFFTKDDNFIIGTIGRLAAEKRQVDLLRAFQIIHQKIHNAKLIIIGDGPEKTNLQLLTKNLKIENSVVFLSYQSNVFSWLKIFDIFVLPSLYEGLSNALIEAMAVGLAVVVSDIPENKEIIQDNKSGLLFPTQQPKIIAEKILILLNNQNLRKQLGYQAQQFIKENFSEEKFLEKINNTINK